MTTKHMSDTTAVAPDTIWSRLAAIGRVGTLLLLPFEVGWVLDSVAGTAAAYNRVVIVTPFDFMLLLLVIGAIPGQVERFRTHHTMGVIAAAVLVAGGALAFVFHPSERGVMVMLRLIASSSWCCKWSRSLRNSSEPRSPSRSWQLPRSRRSSGLHSPSR